MISEGRWRGGRAAGVSDGNISGDISDISIVEVGTVSRASSSMERLLWSRVAIVAIIDGAEYLVVEMLYG